MPPLTSTFNEKMPVGALSDGVNGIVHHRQTSLTCLTQARGPQPTTTWRMSPSSSGESSDVTLVLVVLMVELS